MNSKFLIFLLTGIILLSGCATVSESECRVGDWQTLGKQAGLNGADRSHFHRVAKDCADYGVRGDSAKFEDGRKQGLVYYCTSSGGLKAGRRGYEYKGVCHGDAELEFMRGYLLGRELYLLELEYDDRYQRFHDYRRDFYRCSRNNRHCGYYHHHMMFEEARLAEIRSHIRHKEADATLKIINQQ